MQNKKSLYHTQFFVLRLNVRFAKPLPPKLCQATALQICQATATQILPSHSNPDLECGDLSPLLDLSDGVRSGKTRQNERLATICIRYATRSRSPRIQCGGTHIVLGDVTIQFLSSTMDPQAFIALMTPARISICVEGNP